MAPITPALNEWLSAWIAPDGAFYPVPECEHWVVAMEIRPKASHDAAHQLEESGWCHLTYGTARFSERHKPTQRQLDILFDLAAEAEKTKHYKCQILWSSLRVLIAAS